MRPGYRALGYPGAVDLSFARARLDRLLTGEESAAVASLLGRWEQRILALPERAMRRAVLREVVLDSPVPELVALLARVVERAQEGRAEARELLQELALEPLVFDELPYDRARLAYALAREAELHFVAAVFLGSRANLNPTVEQAFRGNEHLDQPAGIRASWARGADRNRLDRLLHDRDWRVIRLLLDNPRLVERDAVKIAAMRPTRPEILELVATHRRWASRYPVRVALALNPSTPTHLARRLLPTLQKPDLRLALSASGIDPALREQARELLRSA